MGRADRGGLCPGAGLRGRCSTWAGNGGGGPFLGPRVGEGAFTRTQGEPCAETTHQALRLQRAQDRTGWGSALLRLGSCHASHWPHPPETGCLGMQSMAQSRVECRWQMGKGLACLARSAVGRVLGAGRTLMVDGGSGRDGTGGRQGEPAEAAHGPSQGEGAEVWPQRPHHPQLTAGEWVGDAHLLDETGRHGVAP